MYFISMVEQLDVALRSQHDVQGKAAWMTWNR
jgi:hypothetical protein